MNMKDMIQRMADLENTEQSQLNESVDEACGGTPMPPENPGSPVSMNVSLNASGKEHVADLVDMMKNAGLGDAEPVTAKAMPMRMDMERFRDIVDDSEDLEEWDYEPNEEYQDHNYMTKDLSGGLNRRKDQFAKAQDGDNAMAVEADDEGGEAMGPDGEPFDPTRLFKWKDASQMGYDKAVDEYGEKRVRKDVDPITGKELVMVLVNHYTQDYLDQMRKRGQERMIPKSPQEAKEKYYFHAYLGKNGKFLDLEGQGKPFKNPEPGEDMRDKIFGKSREEESIKEQLYKALRTKY